MTANTIVWIVLVAYGLLEVITRGAIVRRLWREVALFFIHMELGAVWIVRQFVRPRHVLLGECQKRGDCCRQILGDPPGWMRKSFVLRIWLAYHRYAHNFEVVGRGPSEEIVFSCNNLTVEGRCSIYRHRPLLCRNYPLVPLFEPPRLLPGCGFTVAPRVVTAMQKRNSLPIVNPVVSVHHPSPDSTGQSQPEHFELVDATGADPAASQGER